MSPQDKRQRQLPLPVRNERGEGRGEGHPTADAQASHRKNDPPLPSPPPLAGGEGKLFCAFECSAPRGLLRFFTACLPLRLPPSPTLSTPSPLLPLTPS